MVTIAPYGTWESAISSSTVVKDATHFCEMQASQDALYWLELSPKDKGRVSLIRYDGEEVALLPNISVRTRVHEYGGGAFCTAKGCLIYSNDVDRQLYSLSGKALTQDEQWRFADGCGPIWVGEKHDQDVENCLVSIEGDEVCTIASGHDFYSSPRLSPDGKQLAFITWDFPNMQWDSSTLWLGDWKGDGCLDNLRAIAGGNGSSVCNVQWSSDGMLYYVCDENGYWNLHRFDGQMGINLCEMEAEFAPPPWVFGMPSYAFLQDRSIICAYTQNGRDYLGRLNPDTGHLETFDLPYTAINNVVFWKGKTYFFGGSPTVVSSIVCYDPSVDTCTIIKKGVESSLSEEWISIPESVAFETADGYTGHALYYPPKNPHFQGSKGEKPPLLVKVHGGPTARASHQLSLNVQYWTSRGYAFVDVNYGGSSGFGRAYRKRLEGNWGVVDVDDVICAAQSLVKEGKADPDRLLIQGGSAGGYTVLVALAFHDVFAGGTSLFGVSDLEMLCKDTHKFEGKYTDTLVAPYPEEIALIRERSPIHHVEKMSKPILFLQGLDDKIVPPDQSIVIFEALKKKKIPTGILLFEGEGHGFRQAKNIKRSLDAQLYFYSQILNIPLPKAFESPPVDIAW